MEKERIRSLLVEVLQTQFSTLDMHTSWLSQIESINSVALIILLEKSFLIEVQASELNERNFSNLESVTVWLEKKITDHADR